MSGTIDHLQADTVTFCVDTNVLVQFLPLAQIPWRQLVPNAARVQIIIPSKVAEEMDAHKKKSGRLRRIGIEFSNLSRQIEDAGVVEIRNQTPIVTVEFGPIFRRSELDSDLFDLDDPDGRVVAEFAAIAASRPSCVLLADDSKPIRIGRAAGMLCTRPLPSWRRNDGPDERDQVISELRRELGAAPELVVRFPDAENDTETLSVDDLPNTEFCETCTAALIGAALSVDQKVSRQTTIERFGLSSGFGFSGSLTDGVTREALAEYEGDYREFTNKISRWAGLVPHLLSVKGALLPIVVEVSNQGDRAAERVQAEVEVSGDFRLLPFDLYETQLEEFLEPPSAPRPTRSPIDFENIDLSRDEARRVDLFHEQVPPRANGGETRISWRCEEFRHGVTHRLSILIAANKTNARGLVTVHLSAAHIAKTSVGRARLLATGSASRHPLCQYIAHRTKVLPQKYQHEIRSRLIRITSCPNLPRFENA